MTSVEPIEKTADTLGNPDEEKPPECFEYIEPKKSAGRYITCQCSICFYCYDFYQRVYKESTFKFFKHDPGFLTFSKMKSYI